MNSNVTNKTTIKNPVAPNGHDPFEFILISLIIMIPL